MSQDLFGLELVNAKPARNRTEAAALLEVLKALRAHRAVAWVERMNSGAVRMGRRFVRFGWRGAPDLLGQLKDGRLLGVEVKAPAGRLRAEQRVFLERIREAGGVAFVARHCQDVLRELIRATEKRTGPALALAAAAAPARSRSRNGALPGKPRAHRCDGGNADA